MAPALLLAWKLQRCSARHEARILRVFGVAFVMFAALAVHPAGGFENVLRVEAAECSCLENLVHRVLGDHHPLSSMRDGQRFIDGAIEGPDYPSTRTRTGHEAQVLTSAGCPPTRLCRSQSLSPSAPSRREPQR